MTFTLDEVEGKYARVLSPNGTAFTVFSADLPEGAREGSLLKKAQGRFVLAPEEENARRAELHGLQEKLRRKNSGV